MEIVLMIVTVVSLVLAVGMSAVGWTLLRADRRRSAARVDALGALAGSADASDMIEIVRTEPIAPRALPAPARLAVLDDAPRAVTGARADEPWAEAWDVEPEPWDIAREAEPLPAREVARARPVAARASES